jgi:hypothetical protein
MRLQFNAGDGSTGREEDRMLWVSARSLAPLVAWAGARP